MENSQLQLGQHKREKSDGEKWCKAEHHSNINKTVPPSPVPVFLNSTLLCEHYDLKSDEHDMVAN